MSGRKKRTPKKRTPKKRAPKKGASKKGAPSHHDPHGETGTADNVVRPNEFLDISIDDYELPDDMMLNVGGDDDDSSSWEFRSEYVHNPHNAGPSGVNNQRSAQNTVSSDPGDSAFENPDPFFEWPDSMRQYDCTYCQVLRNIVHIKGEEEITKLEIHGRIGMISHGILEISTGDMTAPNKEYRTFDFSQKSVSDVKKFLVDYYEARANAYYTTLDDPLLKFYDTLCAQSEYDWVFNDDDQEAQGDGPRPKKRGVVEQRAYCESLTMQDILPYFHLRAPDAAKCIGLGTTKLKNIARAGGLKRWPYRKIKEIDDAIKRILKKMDPSDSVKKAKAEKQIQELQNARAEYYAPFQ